MRFSTKLLSIVSGCFLALLLGGCGNPEQTIAPPAADLTLARFGDETVSVRDFMVEFQESQDFDIFLSIRNMKSSSTGMIQDMPIQSATDVVHGVVEVIGFDRTFAEKARTENLQNSEGVQSYLETTRKDELYQKVVIEDVLKEIRFTENDIRHYYNENRDSLFLVEDTNVYKIRGIYVRTEPERSAEEAYQRIQQAWNELQSGISFESVALVYSDAPPQLRGKLNALPPQIIADPLIVENLESLEPGEYTEIFQTRDRFNIYLLEEFIEPEYQPFENVREQIINQMFLEERNQKLFYLTEILKAKHNCLVNTELLSRTDSSADDLRVLSIPGVYELSLGEFNQQARANRQFTLEERESFLTELANKAVCLAEAQQRGWTEEQVAASLAVWENKRLREEYIWHLTEPHQFTEEQIVEWYDNNKTNRDLLNPPRYDLMYYLFPMEYRLNLSSVERSLRLRQSEALANRFLDIVGNGQPFVEAAVLLESETGVDIRGGSMGSLMPSEMNSQLARAIRDLSVGEISQPEQIFSYEENRYGFEIYYVRGMEPASFMGRDEAIDFIRSRSRKGIYDRIFREQQDAFFSGTEFEYETDVLHDVIAYMMELTSRPDLQVNITRYADS